MFTDMVGYTALTQSDEAHALRVLERHNKLLRPVFPQYNGTEIKTMGDSFLVEFDSALEATNCAIEIQRLLHDYNSTSNEKWKVVLRIGIHLGDIVHEHGDALGDAVNIASRIEPLSEPQGVCVSEQVFDQIHNKISRPLIRVAAKELKNVQSPIDVYRVVMPWEEGPGRREAGGTSNTLRIAVLPFSNMSPDPADEYFADGMTEELIDRLSQVRELRVIARTSVMSYKNKEKKASEISRELGAGTLVEGSVRKAGNRIRVTVQLIDGATEEHLWSSRYDRELNDVFAIQSEISEKVTEQTRVQLLESEKHALERKPTENTEAYALYLKGRYYWSERTRPSVQKGIAYLQKAIEADPNLALAYSDLADAYVMMGDYSMIPPNEADSKIQEYAHKALEMDHRLSQPHAALGTVYARNFRVEDAEREFKEAINLNPNNSTAHHWYAIHLFFQGKEASFIDEWRKAKELDPLSLIIGSVFGYALVRTGHTDEGLAMQRGVTEMNDSFVTAHRNLAYSYVIVGNKSDAVKEARKMLALSTEAEYVSAAACVYAMAGAAEEAHSILNKLLNKSRREYVDPSEIASIHATLGNEANALEWLEKAVMEKSAGVRYVQIYPSFDALRDKLKFKQLVKQIGFD